MGYLKIRNLYQDKSILNFKECYAMEKVHGTSANISWDNEKQEIGFYHGGATRELFVAIFDKQSLVDSFKKINKNITVYGEAYGGKMQRMSATYGPNLKFIAFDVLINDTWLNVEAAEQVVLDLSLEFMPYDRISTNLRSIDACRDKESVVAIRNGLGKGLKREGVVLRPLIELTHNNGRRIISKHKRDDFSETKTPRVVSDEDLKVWSDAKETANEWVTEQRLDHVLDKMGYPGIEQTGQVIKTMLADIKAEAIGEIAWGRTTESAINKATAIMFKKRIKYNL